MSEIPQPQEFFLSTAPYKSYPVGPGDFVAIMRVQFFGDTLDSHCVECGKDGIFRSIAPSLFVPRGGRTSGSEQRVKVDDLVGSELAAYWPAETRSGNYAPTGPLRLSEMERLALEPRVFETVFECTRDPKHRLYFIFRVRENSVEKIGQSPSLADLQLGDVKRYRKLLGHERYSEFTRGIGLHAHGVGIGAFVYLRRIFEDLIEAAHGEAAKEQGWDETAYQRSRMDEKIGLLHAKLPEFLAQNRGIYSILSLGIHDLGEEQCLETFEPLKGGIELILDEKLEQQQRAAKVARTTQAIAKMKGELGRVRNDSSNAKSFSGEDFITN